eukprot:GFUD01104603.1.p1 GENE.GFUD01104603.1~~GFUD01104603.1.p1  ORF type:complete len:108 (-),score=23.57 GFUD01104603.1:19-342(-)
MIKLVSICVSLLIIQGFSSQTTDSYTTGHPGNCWFHKFYYKENAFEDIYILKEYDLNIKANFTCVDGCVYTRVGDPYTMEYCFEQSPNETDEATNKYIMPTLSCDVL